MLDDYKDKKPVIETERLILRDYEPGDVPSLKEWLGNEDLYEYWGRGPLDIEKDPELIFTKGWPRGEGVIPDMRLVIWHREDEKAVGEIQIYDCMDYRIGEVGYRLSPAYREMGIATEALSALVDFAFNNTELERLNALAAVENSSSARVLERAGFTLEGTVRQGRMVNKYCDYNIYGMLRSDRSGVPVRSCEACPLGLYVWRKKFSPEPVFLKGVSVLRGKGENSFLYPAGSGSVKECVSELIHQYPGLTFERVTDEQKEELEKDFPGRFCFTEDRGSFDYLYDIDDLADLKGKKYSKKRNHINAFMTGNEGRWSVEPLTADNVGECREFQQKWYEKRTDGTENVDSEGLTSEDEAISMVLDAYDQLKPDGVLLKIDGECVAFAIGQKVGTDTFDVVFEKAAHQVRGAYNMINKLFAAYARCTYPEVAYINRENDLDIPGLRQAKESYRPALMLRKYKAELR